MPALKAYTADLPYSYAPGVYPSLTLMERMPQRATRLLLSDKASGEGLDKLRTLCKEHGVREEIAPKALHRILGKDNLYAAVVFEKFALPPDAESPHVVLHHPMDAGNLGTIQRTMLGFGLRDLAIIRPSVDPFDPKVVRATMGALFSMRVQLYDDFDDYRADYPAHVLYPFMLDGSVPLTQAVSMVQKPYTLVFGNEGAGLPASFAGLGQAVRIEQSEDVDSLNLAVAAAVAMYSFVHSDKAQEG